MTTPSGAIQSLTRRLFEFETAADSGPDELAAGTGVILSKLYAQLEPLIGSMGFQVLSARALHLTRREFPSLAEVKSGAKKCPGLTGLREAVHGQEPGEASAASMAIIAHLLGLLANFIGEGLTIRLVSRAWPAPPSGDTDSLSDREIL
jgi:hypothetical protein